MALISFLQGKKLTVILAEKVLCACLSDREKTIVKGAADYVIENKKEQGCATLWAFSKEHPASLVPKVLHAKGWRPDNKLDCALFYLLAGDLAHYRSLDFNQSYLRDLYKRGSQALKKAITARIKESGDLELRKASFTIRAEIRPRGILLVDDEESIHLLYKEELEEEGYKVHCALSGEEALRAFYGQSYLGGGVDLVILDINMPEMDGIEVLRRMKQTKPRIPVILSSAYPEYKQDLASWAADDYIVKSFSLDDLKSSVSRLLYESIGF
jgi:CheY-like chemotaxis protein